MFYYSLVLLFESYTEIINTYQSLAECLNAAIPLNGVCIDVYRLKDLKQ